MRIFKQKTMIWNFIKANQFFATYLPEIKDYKRKISGRNGRGNPVSFSPEEEKKIEIALQKMFSDLKNEKQFTPPGVFKPKSKTKQK